MPRRVDLPGAAELFRNTGDQAASARRAAAAEPAPEPAPSQPLGPTGRIKHEEKITVYVSSDELVALEQLRLDLRARHGVGVDRGRIVRAAIADALADLAENGADSRLIQRLTRS